MARTKSTSVEQIVKGISILRGVHQSWPEGSSHSLIAEVLRRAEADFQEELYQALSGAQGTTPAEGSRRVGPKKE